MDRHYRLLLYGLMLAGFLLLVFTVKNGPPRKSFEETDKKTPKRTREVKLNKDPSPKNKKVTVTPNMKKLNDEALRSVLRFYKSYEKEQPYVQDPETYPLEAIEIESVNLIPEMLKDVQNGERLKVYAIKGVSVAAFWKNDVYFVLLLKEDGDEYRELLLYGGGQNGNGVGYEVVDLNEKDDQKEVMISDFQSGNQMSQTRAYIYRYDSSQGKFVEIFKERISWLPMYTPCVYSSKIDFLQGQKNFKDIIIETDLTLYKNSDNKETGSAQRKSTYRWDGKRYAGQLNIPDCGQND